MYICNMNSKAKSSQIKESFQYFVYLLDAHDKLLIFHKFASNW